MGNCDKDPPVVEPAEEGNDRRRRWLIAGVAGITAVAGIIWLTNGGGLGATDSSKPVMSGNEVDDGRGKQNPAPAGAEIGATDQPSGKEPGGKEPSGGKEGKEGKGEGKNGTAEEEKPLPCDPDELIAALAHANANGGGKIRLASECTYILTAHQYGDGLPKIVQPIDLTGDQTTIARAADADPFRIFTVAAGGDLTLRKITLKNGKAEEGQGRTDDRLREAAGNRPAEADLARRTAGNSNGRNPTGGAGAGPGGDSGRGPGAGAEGSAGSGWQDTDSGGGGAVLVKAGGTLRLEHSAVRDSTAAIGGGISNAGTTTLNASTVSDNTAGQRGGGIHNEGLLTADHSHLTYNKARYSGGGLENTRGVANLRHTAVNSNAAGAGGGIRTYGDGTVTTVSDGTISDNTSSRDGGGVQNDGGPLTLRQTTVSRNTAAGDGGGIATTAVLVAEDVVINSNRSTQGSGGGIANKRGKVMLRRTEVTANKATSPNSVGGGILNERGILVLTDTRVIDNSSTRQSGGIFSRNGTVEVDQASVIIKNRPTNCMGSPDRIPNCFG